MNIKTVPNLRAQQNFADRQVLLDFIKLHLVHAPFGSYVQLVSFD
jgi:hypothetical protein